MPSPNLDQVLARGDIFWLTSKQNLSRFQLFAEDPVLDVGCGDLETTRHAPFTSYTGIDVSERALKQAQAKRPDWAFSDTPLNEFRDGSKALVICLDVLIHQSETDGAGNLIDYSVFG